MKTKIFFAILLMVFLSACKKEKDEATIIGVWSLVSINEKEYVNGSLEYDETDMGSTGDFIDFRNDGKVYTSLDGDETENIYTYNNGKITIDNETYEVKDLTKSSLTLYSQESSTMQGENYKFEITIKLKK